jgi:hypothetical protein
MSSEYRQRAAELRRAAEATDLPMIRQSRLSAAERWELLANEAERVEYYSARIKPAALDYIY